jgi:hypothetical protein
MKPLPLFACLLTLLSAPVLLGAPLPDLDLQIVRNRTKKTEGGDFDDKTQKVRLTAVVKNESLEAVEGLKLDIILVGEVMSDELKDGERLVYMDRQSAEFGLQPSETLRKELVELSLQFDESSAARFGQRYFGYVARILQKDGTIVWDDSDKQKLKGRFDDLAKLSKGQQFDKECKLVPSK